jgi:hypothetical protein
MFDWHMALGIVSGAVQVYSIVPYIRGILKGATRPNIISWFLWLVLQSIAIAGQITAGASWPLIFLFATTFNVCLVLFFALKGYGYKKYGWLDFACLFCAIAAIIIWRITNEPVMAILMAVVADFIALIPTIWKTYKEPFSETAVAWLLLAIAAILAIISTTKFDAPNLLYPAYSAISALVVAALAHFGQRLNNNKI